MLIVALDAVAELQSCRKESHGARRSARGAVRACGTRGTRTFVNPSRGTAGCGCSVCRALARDHVHLDRGVAAAVKDLACFYRRDGLLASLVCKVRRHVLTRVRSLRSHGRIDCVFNHSLNLVLIEEVLQGRAQGCERCVQGAGRTCSSDRSTCTSCSVSEAAIGMDCPSESCLQAWAKRRRTSPRKPERFFFRVP